MLKEPALEKVRAGWSGSHRQDDVVTGRVSIAAGEGRGALLLAPTGKASDGLQSARRYTNLLAPPAPLQVQDRYVEEGLHLKTRRGEAVRSKSDFIVADELHTLGIAYEYERELRGTNGQRRWPDFAVEDQARDRRLLGAPRAARRSRVSGAMGAEAGVVPVDGVAPFDEGGGPNGTLVTTRDTISGAIDSAAIERLARQMFGL